MKSLILILAGLLPLAAQSLSYGTIARPGATIDFRNAATVLPDRHLTADPATCTPGEKYFNTATAKARRCTATDTWSDEAGSSYTLPPATASTLGGIKIGAGLAIDGGGVLSAGASGGATCDPFNLGLFCLVEDFVTGSTSNGQIGANGLLWNSLSSGTLTYFNVTSAGQDTNHPGILRILSTTSTNSGGSLVAGNAATTGNFNLWNFLNNEWEVRWIAKVESPADARVRIGLSQSTAIAPGAGEISMFFRYDNDAAFADGTKNTSGSWVAQFCGYSSGACTDGSGQQFTVNVAADNAWHLFSLRRSGSTFYWRIDNTDVATMCATGCSMTTPAIGNPANTTPFSPRVTFGISGTTQRGLQVDYLSVKITGNYGRY